MKKVFIFSLLLLTISCSVSKKECSEINAYEVVPGVGIGPYKLGMKESELLSVLCPQFTKKSNDSWFGKGDKIYYFIENMTFTIENGKLKQIVSWGSFNGSFRGIHLDYEKEVLEQLGEVIKYKGEYRIIDIPYITFGIPGTDEGSGFTIYK